MHLPCPALDCPALPREGQPPCTPFEAFGFECDDGWYAPLLDMSRALALTGEPVTILQVKEKFGRLDVNMSPCGEAIRRIVAQAENATCTMCESCGAFGTCGPIGGGSAWLKTYCDPCREREAEAVRRRLAGMPPLRQYQPKS